jgi:hypothetical protein
MSFTVPHSDDTYRGISLYLSKSGTIGNDVVIQIQTDNAGSPSGSVVTNASFAITSASITAGGAGFYLTNSANQFSLTANTRYWIVAKCGSGISDGDVSNFFQWHGCQGVTATYGRGNMKTTANGGTAWTDWPTYDLAFKLHYGGKAEASAPNLTLDVDYYKRWL